MKTNLLHIFYVCFIIALTQQSHATTYALSLFINDFDNSTPLSPSIVHISGSVEIDDTPTTTAGFFPIHEFSYGSLTLNYNSITQNWTRDQLTDFSISLVDETFIGEFRVLSDFPLPSNFLPGLGPLRFTDDTIHPLSPAIITPTLLAMPNSSIFDLIFGDNPILPTGGGGHVQDLNDSSQIVIGSSSLESLNLQTIPEPTSSLSLAIGLAGFLSIRRRRS